MCARVGVTHARTFVCRAVLAQNTALLRVYCWSLFRKRHNCSSVSITAIRTNDIHMCLYQTVRSLICSYNLFLCKPMRL